MFYPTKLCLLHQLYNWLVLASWYYMELSIFHIKMDLQNTHNSYIDRHFQPIHKESLLLSDFCHKLACQQVHRLDRILDHMG